MFKVGQKVVCIESFEDLREIWGFNYPRINDIVKVLSIKKHHSVDNEYLITVTGLECEVCARCFKPLNEHKLNKEEKTNLDLDIMNLVNKLIESPENTNDVVMYMRGDREFKTASINIKGDIQLMASVIQHHLDNNEEFKRFILSVIGSWLAKNPVDELMFLNGIDVAKKTFSIN